MTDDAIVKTNSERVGVRCFDLAFVAADMMQELVRVISRWMRRTPVQTFVLCPLAVMAAETVARGGHLIIVHWGAVPLIWGYLQYRLVGRYRGLVAGGGPGMQKLPERGSAACCARTDNGSAIAEPPTIVRNSRRRMSPLGSVSNRTELRHPFGSRATLMLLQCQHRTFGGRPASMPYCINAPMADVPDPCTRNKCLFDQLVGANEK